MFRLDTGRTPADLLGGATLREPWGPNDTKAGARFERVVIDGCRYVVEGARCL